jgi:ribonucleoside-triphosphate reductase (thioredoxin)
MESQAVAIIDISTVQRNTREKSSRKSSESFKTFEIDLDFIKEYVGKQPNWGPLGRITYVRTYSRSLECVPARYRDLGMQFGLQDSEDWWLTVTRVVEGCYRIQQTHCKGLKLSWDPEKAQESAQEMFQRIWAFKMLPPGRGLWMSGTDFVDKIGSAAMQNCAYVTTDDIRVSFSEPFCFLMNSSMLGIGVGSDTRGAGKVTIVKPVIGEKYVVDDSREGWVDLIRCILESYVGRDELPVSIDYSKIRPAGSLIRGFGGTSSGHAPLEELVKGITTVLDKRIGQSITSEDIVDVHNMIGRCVVAGNIRRSSEILLGDPDDDNFLNLKNPSINEEAVKGWRWSSNNSILANIGQDYSKVASMTESNGEPGYLWLENARNYARMNGIKDNSDSLVKGVNPCGEIVLESAEYCNLVECFPAHNSDLEDFKRTLKFAYLYAKTVSLLPTHDYKTNSVVLRNRRIGVSMSGISQALTKLGKRVFLSWCDAGYNRLKELDAVYSGWLCVPKSIRLSTIKPSGTTSLLVGATPGIHFPHSEYYYRVIRFAADSPLLVPIKEAGYRCVDLRPDEPNTVAVYFAVKEENFSRCKSEVSMWEQLEIAAQVQTYWADNAISCTVSFNPGESKQIKHALELYESRLKSVSFLPLKDHGYNHAPYQEISKEEYDSYMQNLGPLEFRGKTNEIVEKFCDGDNCVI